MARVNYLFGSQSSSHRSRLLRSELLRHKLLVLVQLSELLLHVLVVDREHPCDILSDDTDLRQLGSGSSHDLGNPQGLELALELAELTQKLSLRLIPDLMCLDLAHPEAVPLREWK